MRVETKYNIGDEVYYMNCNIPMKSKIEGINILFGTKKEADGSTMQCPTPYIVYYMEPHSTKIHEKELYATKQELQQAMFDSLD